MAAPTLTQIRDGIRTRLATIAGLRAYSHLDGNIEPPVAVVVPRSAEYDETMRDGEDRLMLWVIVAASRGTDRNAQAALDSYLARGTPQSVKAAIEADATLGGIVDWTWVRGWDSYGDVDIGGVSYFGARLVVEVSADGS